MIETPARLRNAMTGFNPMSASQGELGRLRFDWGELAGAVGDLGVLVPIGVALIVQNRLSATAVLLPAGLLYLAAGLLYRLPVPVQPLKAFGAIAIAQGLGSNEIAAGALLMGAVFVVLGTTGLLNQVARIFPHPIIRGVQLSVGLLFCELAWKLTTAPPAGFADHGQPIWWLVTGAVIVILAGLTMPRRAVALVLATVTIAAIVLANHGPLMFGPSPLFLPRPKHAGFHHRLCGARVAPATFDICQFVPGYS